jgi:ASC-1-like (ASCH) protein
MQTITFTTDDTISQLLNEIAIENNKPTNEVIAESLRYYAQMLQKKKLQQKIKQASALTAKQSLLINQLLQASDSDGL